MGVFYTIRGLFGAYAYILGTNIMCNHSIRETYFTRTEVGISIAALSEFAKLIRITIDSQYSYIT